MAPERGTVVEVRGGSALVRLEAGPACAGCASAGFCRSGAGGGRLLEARNAPGAVPGDVVEVAPPPGTALLRYLVPLGGLLGGAALAQLAAAGLGGPGAAPWAAGAGGALGGLLGVVAGGRLAGRARRAAPQPSIRRVVSGAGRRAAGR